MTQRAQRRSVKNVKLTERFHWPYVGGWLAFNIVLLILIEVCVLATLSNLAPSGIAAGKLATASLAGSVIMAALMVFVGVMWAHRLAGVHLRTESTFLQVTCRNSIAKAVFVEPGDKVCFGGVDCGFPLSILGRGNDPQAARSRRAQEHPLSGRSRE